jgi:hypothetical protein
VWIIATLTVGLGLAWWYVRRPEPVLMRAARAGHTGSVNDYTAYAVLRTVMTLTAVLIF